MRKNRRWTLPTASLILVTSLAAPAFAGSVEVTLRERDGGRPVQRETVVLEVVSGADTQPYRRWTRPHVTTDLDGRARFEDLAPGSYVVTLPWLSQRELLRPRDNPFAPPPKVALFEAGDEVRIDVELWRGIRTTVSLDLPGQRFDGFTAIYRHRETGSTLSAPFPRDQSSVARRLAPGVWDVSVAPLPGYLLVGVEHDRLSVPGSSVRLDLAQDPRESYLQFTYTAPAELEGNVQEERGLPPAVHVEAALVEPGPWIDAARRRGGSVYERVIAGVDADTGDYEMVLPDGQWRVRPIGSLLAASTPEAIDLDLAPGTAGRADFTVRLEGGVGEDSLVVVVRSPQGGYVARAAVEVHTAGGGSERLREGTTDRYGRAVFPSLGEGTYRVFAGHPDYLESNVLAELEEHGSRQITVTLEPGAEIRVTATDVEDLPLPEVEVTVERLGELPELTLQDPELLEAKQKRRLTTDQSGRAALHGFYPGTWLATARLRGQSGTRGLIHLGLGEGRLERELEVDVTGSETIDLVARMLPAASWTASVVCTDPNWALPDAADVRVFDALTNLVGVDLDQADAGGGMVLALPAAVLTGRHRDTLAIGPLRDGVYRLAVRPLGFERWTWAYETTDPQDAAELRADPGENGEPGNLGDFQVECGPALDLLPAVAAGGPFPDLQEVEVAAQVLDRDGGHEIARPPLVGRRRGRLEVRGLPRGEMRLDVALTHPHFLPVPTQSWQVDLELERGQFREIVVQIEAVGGALRIEGAGAAAWLRGPGDEVREAVFRDRRAELPSLVPGRYLLEVVDAAGTVLREWPDLEVPAGETVRLTVEP